MDTYSSTTENTAAVISSHFFRRSSAASASSRSFAVTSGFSAWRVQPKPAFYTLALICSGVTWVSS